MTTNTLRTLAFTPLFALACTAGVACIAPGCGWLQTHPNSPAIDESAALCVVLRMDEILAAASPAEEIAAAIAVAADCKVPQAVVQNFATQEKQAMVKYQARMLKRQQAAPITSSAPFPSVAPNGGAPSGSASVWPAVSASVKGAK